MDLLQTNQFIHNLLLELSHHTTYTLPSEYENEIGISKQCYSRQIQNQPASAFPTTQLTNIRPLMLTLHCIFPNEFLPALDILDRGFVKRIRTQCMDRTEDHGEHTRIDTLMEDENPRRDQRTPQEDFFFVTSASANPNTVTYPATQAGNHPEPPKPWQDKGYEIRLQAWNCTCSSFTISAFRELDPEPSSTPSPTSPTSTQMVDMDAEDDSASDRPHTGEAVETAKLNADADIDADHPDTTAYAYSFGGTLSLHPGSAPPVCKHILACLLAALCPGLGVTGKDGDGRFVTLNPGEVAGLSAGWGG
ncbi:hypothetical protein BJY04DRAFT_60563 [Aspergillus karnatakaensis]|uniref:uncharacterized protein n=1 Tax=Aspergillus karnatakaensis TaxID=1810916 RepID=UPI003CCCBEA6